MSFSFAKLEKEVKKNSISLDTKIKGFIEKHENQYIVFHNGDYIFTDNFGIGVESGIKQFGENTGFVVKKVTEAIPVLSCLVKL